MVLLWDNISCQCLRKCYFFIHQLLFWSIYSSISFCKVLQPCLPIHPGICQCFGINIPRPQTALWQSIYSSVPKFDRTAQKWSRKTAALSDQSVYHTNTLSSFFPTLHFPFQCWWCLTAPPSPTVTGWKFGCVQSADYHWWEEMRSSESPGMFIHSGLY